MARTELAAQITNVARLEGSFLLRSGITADVYFDKYQFEADPQILREIAAQLVERIPADTEILAGLEMGGIPIATALSLATGLPTVFVRKEAKKYGTAKLAEGPSIEGKKLLVVEDVVTSGGQIVLSVGELRGLGATIESAICVINREQGGPENLDAIDVKLDALFTRTELEA